MLAKVQFVVISFLLPPHQCPIDVIFQVFEANFGRCFFMTKKHPSSFLWPSLGLALYEAKPYSNDQLCQYLLNSSDEILMPSLSQIDDQLTKGEFDSRSYPIAAYAYMDFLVSNWGLDKALNVLENYPAFESILRISQEEFQKKCIEHYQKKLVEN